MSGFVSGFGNKKIENKSIDYSKVVVSSDNIRVYSNSVLTNDDGAEEVYLDPNVVPDNFIGPLAPGQRYESDEPVHLNVPNNDWIFGDKALETGQYGGNQESLSSNCEKYMNDPKIDEIINKYYSNVSNEDKELLFYRMMTCGCGYVACINTIMFEYIFRGEDEFMEKFGYRPYELEYDDNGKLYKKFNYDYLFLDFFLYCAKEEGYENIKDVYGSAAKEREYRNGDAALDSNSSFETGMTGAYAYKVVKTLQSFLNSKGIKMTYEGRRELEIGSDEWKKKKEELEAKGIPVDDDEKLFKDLELKSGDDFQKYLDEGKQICISSRAFKMYSDTDVNNNNKYDDVVYGNVDPHGMYVVGTTSDPNKIVVSSWGQRYIIDIDYIDSVFVCNYYR